FDLHPDGAVRALTLDENTLFIGGEFNLVDGQARTRLAAFDLNTRVLLPWAPEANGGVSNIVVAGDSVYVGGFFTTMGGQPRNNIAALDRATGIATSWNPNANGVVRAMALLNDRLIVGGFFNSIGGQLRNGLASLYVNVSANNATGWDPNPLGGKVTTLSVVCNTVYVGGYFTNIAGLPRSRVAAIDADSGQATSWNPDVGLLYSPSLSSYVVALQISGETVYLGGQFITAGGEQRVDLAAVNATTGQALAWAPNPDGGVSTFAVGGRRILAGFIASPGGKQRRNLAAFDPVTGTPADWNPDADGEVLSLASAGNIIYAGGSFSKMTSVPRSHLAALDGVSGGSLAGWTNILNGDVRALTIVGNTLYAGGSFTSVGGTTRQRLAAFNASTGQLLPNWAPLTDGTVYALAASGNTIYAGGNFVTIGQTRRHLAALDATTAQLQSWDPGADDKVLALALA
ncbi:MAG TPA: hypothetical protein VNM37_09610, partial [Candidatus Dormibacteraeota bacterium]|nr:hypothetical protein [Candidatus Dormibacteraeota bacterium]